MALAVVHDGGKEEAEADGEDITTGSVPSNSLSKYKTILHINDDRTILYISAQSLGS